jgi:hypothetical protein
MFNKCLEIVDAEVRIACGHAATVDVVRMFELMRDFEQAGMPLWEAEAAKCAEEACGMGCAG